MRDIAKQAGVSHVTVSLSLRDLGSISLETKERIHRIAENLGYRSDPILTALVAYRTDKKAPRALPCIAWINTSSDGTHTGPELDSIWKGAIQAATKLGFRLEEFRITGGMTPRRLHEILQSNHVFGILLPPQEDWRADWKYFPWDEYAVVKIGHSLDAPLAHIVSSDHISDTVLAYESMLERGCRRIAVVAGEAQCRQERLLHGVALIAAQVKRSDGTEIPRFEVPVLADEGLNSVFSDWLRQHRPDAILSCYKEIHALLESVGMRVPEDIGLSIIGGHEAGWISGIDINYEEIGREGILQLYTLFIEGTRGIPEILRTTLLPGQWKNGTSLAARSNNVRQFNPPES